MAAIEHPLTIRLPPALAALLAAGRFALDIVDVRNGRVTLFDQREQRGDTREQQIDIVVEPSDLAVVTQREQLQSSALALLAYLADSDPMTVDSSEEGCCFFCRSGESVDRTYTYWHIGWGMLVHPIYVYHAHDCFWVQVRAAVHRDANAKHYLHDRHAALMEWEEDEIREHGMIWD